MEGKEFSPTSEGTPQAGAKREEGHLSTIGEYRPPRHGE
jgi:hypothetical protein